MKVVPPDQKVFTVTGDAGKIGQGRSFSNQQSYKDFEQEVKAIAR